MKWISLILGLMAMNCTAQTTLLEEHRWENRVLLVFADRESDEQLQQQLDIFETHETDVLDRDLVVYELVGEQVRYKDKTLSANNAVWRTQYDVQQDFQVLLIGKDGGVKMRKSKVVAMQDINDLIDSMPMRRAEMRKKH